MKTKRWECERRGWSEVRRKTGSVKKVGWDVSEKSNWSWMAGSLSVIEEERKTSARVSSSEASWLL